MFSRLNKFSDNDTALIKKFRDTWEFIVSSWERWRVPRSREDETSAPRYYINIRGERVLRTGGAPAFFLFYLALPRKLKSNYFDASARPGSADSNEFFARASPQFALSTRVKPVRSAQRPSPSCIHTIHPWSIRDYDFGSSWQLLRETRTVRKEGREGWESGQRKGKSERERAAF